MPSDVLRGLRGIDGRKTVLLFSEGFYGANVAPRARRRRDGRRRDLLRIYAFDLNRRIDLAAAESSAAADSAEIQNRIEPLGSLAAETSGALIKDAGTGSTRRSRRCCLTTPALPDRLRACVSRHR